MLRYDLQLRIKEFHYFEEDWLAIPSEKGLQELTEGFDVNHTEEVFEGDHFSSVEVVVRLLYHVSDVYACLLLHD